MEANDTKVMREALAEARKVIEAMGGYWARETLPIIDAALATPPRNCDIGTAQEQYARFNKYCNARWYKNDKPNPCGRASGASNPCAKCYSVWAQMPYKEKEESSGSK